jgi:protein SCO1/2
MTAAHVRLAVLAAAGFAAGALTAFALLPQARERLFPGPAPAVRSSGRALVGGPFSLTDHDGKRITDAAFRGRIMLVVFGATSSPDLLPATLQVLSAALDKLGPGATRFVPVFITAAPERDTPERLKPYVARFHPRLVGLTGTPAEIARVLAAYRIRGARRTEDAKGPAGDAPEPPPLIYVMGADGSFRTVLNFAAGADAIAATLAKMP